MSILSRFRAFIRPSVVQISLGNDAPTQVLNYTAKKLYQSQDNLQAVVNFLSNSIAQLPLKVYVRDGEDERKRDRDSAAAKLLYRPNPDQTAFEFFRAVAIEYFVFGCVYVWIVPDDESESGYQMRIIPSEWVIQNMGGTAYASDAIRVSTRAGEFTDIPRDEFVAFKMYSPGNPAGYISPISGLRQTLNEQIEAGRFRKELWHSSGRLNAQITRPKDVAPWDDETKKKFVTAFREAWGSGGSKAGSIPLLEDGMEIKPFQTNFKEQQWAESIKLSREAVAAAYGVNPSLIWHTDTQTYASSKDNARALYAECLGPILQMIQQRINAFLLPMVGAPDDMYVEFDLHEKLKGSFEERAAILQSATGGPWMTRNEARADNNLPPVEGGDELIVPLNVVEGGQASPTDTHMDPNEPATVQETEKCSCGCHYKSEPIRIKGRSDTEEDDRMTEALQKFLKHQADSVLPKIGAKAARWWDADRWDAELADDIEVIMDDIADRHGKQAAASINRKYSTEVTRNYLKAMAAGRARAINVATYKKLLDAAESEDEENTPAAVFEKRENTAGTAGRSLATAVASWAVLEAVHQAQRDGDQRKVMKVWETGDNARPSHQAMNGETVPVDDNFSNGAYWPGDDNLDPDESCGCNCSTSIVVEG